eukprot:9764899-Prorocentrum_lima.AAC.1
MLRSLLAPFPFCAPPGRSGSGRRAPAPLPSRSPRWSLPSIPPPSPPLNLRPPSPPLSPRRL